jgi:hypothetical protein
MTEDDSSLNELFRGYRASCPDIEPSAQFIPGLWQKIEARQGVWFMFQRLARPATTACAALCLLLLLLNFVAAPQNRFSAASYADALLAEHNPENTYYTEAVRSTMPGSEAPEKPQH